jgi:DNA adenine methylase
MQAVFFAVRSRARQGATLSDLNEELINAWRAVRNRPNLFLKAIENYYGKDLESHYYKIRDQQPLTSIGRAARFFYLNQTSWNALWRVNRWGPWGARPFRGISAAEVQLLSKALQKIEIDTRDFRQSLSLTKIGDFVYLDPPYLPVSDTSKFSGYTERRFRKSDLEELADHCRQLSRRNVAWVMSNRDTPLVRDLFSFAKIIRLTTRRSVSAQNRRDIEPADSPEVIVVGRTAH